MGALVSRLAWHCVIAGVNKRRAASAIPWSLVYLVGFALRAATWYLGPAQGTYKLQGDHMPKLFTFLHAV